MVPCFLRAGQHSHLTAASLLLQIRVSSTNLTFSTILRPSEEDERVHLFCSELPEFNSMTKSTFNICITF